MNTADKEGAVKSLAKLWEEFGEMYASLPPWQAVEGPNRMIIATFNQDPIEHGSAMFDKCLAEIDRDNKSDLEYRANTRLMCASPLMFEVLFRLLAFDRSSPFLAPEYRDQIKLIMDLIFEKGPGPMAKIIDLGEIPGESH